MSYSLPISPAYRRTIFEALALQAVVAVISGMALDFGQAAQICGIALLAFWSGVLVLIWRRPLTPSPLDLSLVRVGYLPVVVLAAVLVPVIWRLRGVW